MKPVRFSPPTAVVIQGLIFAGFTTVLTIAAVAPSREKLLVAFAPFDAGPASISPDGKHLAYFQREKKEPVIYIVNLASAQPVFRAVVGVEDNTNWVGETFHTEPLRITFLRWADNNRVVVATSYNHFFVLDRVARTGRHLINLTGEAVILGAETGNLSGAILSDGRFTGRVIALLPGEPAWVMIEASKWMPGNLTSHSLLKINIATGKVETATEEVTAGKLIYDPEGHLRGRYQSGYVVDQVFLLKNPAATNRWQPLEALHPVASVPHSPLKGDNFFGPRAFLIAIAGDLLYFASNVGRNTLGIYAIDLPTGKQTPLAIEDSAVDLAALRNELNPSDLVVDRLSHEVVGIRVQGIKRQTRWLDADLAALQTILDTKARGAAATIVDWDNARDRFVIELHSRADPGSYFLYTRSADKLHRIVDQRTNRGPVKVTSTDWSIRGPDGANLSGWLTVPDTPVSGSARPVVVRLSGPWFGATNVTNPEVIALSQMGYSVLEVNHRGISGLGVAHLQAGRNQVDVVAAADILAALDALALKGAVDPTRIALFGTHFGGYLALRAVQLHPDRFRCAVTIEPATNLVSWTRLRFEDSAYNRFQHEADQWFFGTDKKELLAASPITDPKSIRAPLLLAVNPDQYQYGWSDAKTLRRKLTAAGNPPTFIEITAGANVPGQEQSRLWEKIEDFLGRNLVSSPAR